MIIGHSTFTFHIGRRIIWMTIDVAPFSFSLFVVQNLSITIKKNRPINIFRFLFMLFISSEWYHCEIFYFFSNTSHSMKMKINYSIQFAINSHAFIVWKLFIAIFCASFRPWHQSVGHNLVCQIYDLTLVYYLTGKFNAHDKNPFTNRARSSHHPIYTEKRWF